MSAPAAEAPIGPSERDALLAPLAASMHILVATSGGPDSVALLGLLAAWAEAGMRPELSAATVDHGLRPEAVAEAEAVGDLCRRLGVAHTILTWRPAEIAGSASGEPDGASFDPDARYAGRGGAGVSQAKAREARYGMLLEHAHRIGALHLALAHHRDDQAETLLMRMAAGSGLAGLAGMRPLSGRGDVVLARPFLDLPKARLVATCRAEGWPFALDPSNVRRHYARTRWRELVPALAAEGLDAERLGTLAARLARAEDALAATAMAAFIAHRLPDDGGRLSLDMARLAAEPAEIVLRVLGLAVSAVASGTNASLRLERLESCGLALVGAAGAQWPLRRTLAGRLLSLDVAGRLIVTAEGARRRGRQAALTLPALELPPSLGTETLRT